MGSISFLPEYAAYLEGTKINNIKLKWPNNKTHVRIAIRLRNIVFIQVGIKFNSILKLQKKKKSLWKIFPLEKHSLKCLCIKTSKMFSKNDT